MCNVFRINRKFKEAQEEWNLAEGSNIKVRPVTQRTLYIW